MYSENPTGILSYAQKVFEQSYRGKLAYSVLEYWNNPVLLEELRKEIDSCSDPPQVMTPALWEEFEKDLACPDPLWARTTRMPADPIGMREIVAVYQKFSSFFADKRHNFCVKQKKGEVLTEEELITEEDLVRLIDCAVLAFLRGDGEGFTSVGCELDVLKREGLLDQCRFLRRYLSELNKLIADESKFYFQALDQTLARFC